MVSNQKGGKNGERRDAHVGREILWTILYETLVKRSCITVKMVCFPVRAQLYFQLMVLFILPDFGLRSELRQSFWSQLMPCRLSFDRCTLFSDRMSSNLLTQVTSRFYTGSNFQFVHPR
jgi:hypothetical protein